MKCIRCGQNDTGKINDILDESLCFVCVAELKEKPVGLFFGDRPSDDKIMTVIVREEGIMKRTDWEEYNEALAIRDALLWALGIRKTI